MAPVSADGTVPRVGDRGHGVLEAEARYAETVGVITLDRTPAGLTVVGRDGGAVCSGNRHARDAVNTVEVNCLFLSGILASGAR